MKSVLVFAVAGAVLAQNMSGEPACAIPCITSAIVAAGCHLTDQGCACSKTAQIEPLCAPCLLKACPAPSDISQAAAAGSTLCKEYSKSHGLTAAVIATATATGGDMEPMEDVEEDMEMGMTVAITTIATVIPTATSPAQLVTVTKGGSTVTMEWTTMTMSGSVVTMLMPVPTNSAQTTATDGSSTIVEADSTNSANAAATPAAAMGAGAFAALGLAAAF